MTDLEKHETEKVANQLADAIHDFNKLNKEQIDYLDLIYKKLTIDSKIDKINKGILITSKNKKEKNFD